MTKKEKLTAAEIRRRARAFVTSEIAGGNRETESMVNAHPLNVRKPWMLWSFSYMPAESTELYTGYGFAKVAYPDKWDSDEGIRLVTARAIKDLALQLIAAEEYCGQDIPLD